MIKKSAIILISFLFLSACAKKNFSLEEQQHDFNLKLKYSKKEYSGFSEKELMVASKKVFEHLDPDDTTFELRENGFDAYRKAVFFTFLANGASYDRWLFRLRKTNSNGYIASIKVKNNTTSTPLILIMPKKETGNVSFHESQIIPAEAWGFFKRLDYFLGITNKWTTCTEVKDFSKNILGIQYSSAFKYRGYGASYFCGGYNFGISDYSPQEYQERNKMD